MTARPDPGPWYTTRAAGQQIGVCANYVVGLIHAGKLDAANIASDGARKPRYRVSEQALARYMAAVAVKPAGRGRSVVTQRAAESGHPESGSRDRPCEPAPPRRLRTPAAVLLVVVMFPRWWLA